MPIDLALIAADWAEQWRAQTRAVANSIAMLGPWLAQRLQQLRTLEQRTRAFPVFAFEGRALSLAIAPAQFGVVRPYKSTGAAVAAPFVAFGRGFARVGQAVADEWILPGVLSAVAKVLALVDKSIGKFMKPDKSQFDPKNASASDLFGLLGMAWRGLSHSTVQLRAYATDISDEMRKHMKPGAGAAGAAAGAAASGALPAAAEPVSPNPMVDDVQRWITGAILVLPALPRWIEILVRAAWIKVRDMALDEMQSIERELFDLRASVLRSILSDLPAALREIPALVATMGALVEWSIRYYARLTEVWFEIAVFAINLFLDGLRWVVNGFLGLLNTVIAVFDAILHTDLLMFIKPLLGPAGLLLDKMGVRLTLDDLIEAGTGAVNMAMKTTLLNAINVARGGVLLLTPPQIPLISPKVGLSEFQQMLLGKLDLMEQVVKALFKDTGKALVETEGPPPPASMPNLYDEMFGKATPAELGKIVKDFGGVFATRIGGFFDVVSTTLTDAAVVFATTATDVARTGPSEQMLGFGRTTQGLVGDLYDDQIELLGKRLKEAPPNAFERWLVQGGFEVIGAAIPLYMREMRRWWHEQAEEGNAPMVDMTPTSPHILVRRAYLGRVHMPRLTLRANGRAHDETLVADLVMRCQGAIEAAYLEGHRRLGALKAAAG